MKVTLALLISLAGLLAQQPGVKNVGDNVGDEREIFFKEKMLKAVSGDVDAQLFIADAYLRGSFPAARDEKMGLVWMEKAALSGNRAAAQSMALWFLNKPDGRSNPEHVVEWIKWFSVSERKMHNASGVSEATHARAHAKVKEIFDKYPVLGVLSGVGSPAGDERVIKFNELLARAELGDASSQYEAGRIYLYGEYPVAKDELKGREWIERAALSGHAPAAQQMALMCMRQTNGQTDPNLVAERVKWLSIQQGFPYKNSEISQSTLAEGHRRAESIWQSRPNLKRNSGELNVAQPGRGIQEKKPSALPKVYNLDQFNDMRRRIVSAYVRASSPVYNKGNQCTPEEQNAFVSAALELKSLQGVLKRKPISYKSSGSNDAMAQINTAKVRNAYDRIAFANIKTEYPCSRAEQNEASKFISALNDLMSLPVEFAAAY